MTTASHGRSMMTASVPWDEHASRIYFQDINLVHEMTPFGITRSYCGFSFVGRELHPLPRVVTCLWCAVRRAYG